MLSGVRTEAGVWGDMGLADDGYMDEVAEEGPDEGDGPRVEDGPMEGEGRGADGGSISALEGGFEAGACCYKMQGKSRHVTSFLKKSDIRLSNWFLGSWARAEAKASQLAHGCQQSEGFRVLTPWGEGWRESISLPPKPAKHSQHRPSRNGGKKTPSSTANLFFYINKTRCLMEFTGVYVPVNWWRESASM